MRVLRYWFACVLACVGPCAAANATEYWSDSFESGDFSRWSYVQGQDPTQGGPGPEYVYVPSYTTAHVPQLNGTYVAHFERPASAVNYPQAKIYKEWTTVGKLDQFRRVEDPIFNNGNVSAVYIAWFYFPSNYTCSENWVNIFQFKEQGYNAAGEVIQDPSWWINVGYAASFGGTSTQCVMFINHWGNTYVNYKPKTLPVPLGTWFEVRAFLYQGDRIDWYINDKLFDTSLNSTWPVGRFYAVSTGWTLGVGHYEGFGTLYVDYVRVLSLFPEP